MFILAVLPILFLGCVKTADPAPPCTDVLPLAEETEIIAYCNANSIIYSKDPSGIFYQIIDPGTAPHPSPSSMITVKYVGKLLNGAILDQSTTDYTNRLNLLVNAWQVALPLIGKGGHIKMVARSSLCYGCSGVQGAVAPNTILFFDITLVDVQ